MRVVIVTGTNPHHKNLCAVIAREFNVVGIIHPCEPKSGFMSVVRRYFIQADKQGWPLIAHYLLGKLYSKLGGSSGAYEKPVTRSIDFSEGVAAYEDIPKSLIYSNCDVRDSKAHDYLKALQPDVTICLGGPVYPKGFIDASPLTLNFHSGISPFYNGTASIQFAFANGHLHLCGGTLMMMSTEIDGGQVLGHYLPMIEAGDTPTDLFNKTVLGAGQMYTQILAYLQSGNGEIQKISQPSALFYSTNLQLGLYQRAMIVKNLKAGISVGFQRPESIIEYWRENDPGKAKELFFNTLEDLLWK